MIPSSNAGVLASLQEGKRLHQALGYSTEKLEEYYTAAYAIYEREDYQDAADAFFTLSVLDPEDARFWLALGMSEHKCERYASAIYGYGMAIYLDVSNPLTHYLLACCYEQQREPAEALAAADLALHYAQEEYLITLITELKERL